MQRARKILLILVLAACRVAGFSGNGVGFSGNGVGFSNDGVAGFSGNGVDVLYFVSTNVISSRDSGGVEQMTSLLTAEDRRYMDKEDAFVRDSIFPSFRFFAPYYHQYTFDSFTRYPERMDSVREAVGREVCGIFDDYMAHDNQGRPFILAGFSQGGDMVMHVLRHMTAEESSRMVAAYVIGFQVTAGDTAQYAAVRPARGAGDTGVTISFNSVLSREGIWPFVAGEAAVCINPLNWRTDSVSAQMMYRGNAHSVRVDSACHVLMVSGESDACAEYRQWMTTATPFAGSGIHPDCLHHWDILFYTRALRENALLRTANATSVNAKSAKHCRHSRRRPCRLRR